MSDAFEPKAKKDFPHPAGAPRENSDMSGKNSPVGREVPAKAPPPARA